MSAIGTTFTNIKLAACFSCGSNLGPFVLTPDGIRQVVCSTCGARGAHENAVKSAEQLWNEVCDKVQ